MGGKLYFERPPILEGKKKYHPYSWREDLDRKAIKALNKYILNESN